MSAPIIKFFLTLRNSMKIYHWSTLSHPRHTASDELIGKLDKLSDSFVEVYIGRYGRDRLPSSRSKKDVEMTLPCLSEGLVVSYLEEAREWLAAKLPDMLKKSDTELLNIRDEIIGEINQAIYLFALK